MKTGYDLSVVSPC